MAWARRSDYSQVVWFIIDGWVRWDRDGWEFMIRTPLFGGVISRNWPSVIKVGRTSRRWFGLIARWPVLEGGIMYMWNWERETSFIPYREVLDGHLEH